MRLVAIAVVLLTFTARGAESFVMLSNPSWDWRGDIAFTPDGSRLLVTRNGGIDVLASESWSVAGALVAAAFGPVRLAVDPNGGRVLASGMSVAADDEWNWVVALRSWRTDRDGSVEVLAGVDEQISAVACSSTGVVACGTFPGRVWLLDAGESEGSARQIGPSNSVVNSLAFSRDGRLLAAVYRGNSGGTRRVTVYRVSDGAAVHTIDGESNGGAEFFKEAAFTPDGRTLAVCGDAAECSYVSLWSISDWEKYATLRGPSHDEWHGVVYYARLSVSTSAIAAVVGGYAEAEVAPPYWTPTSWILIWTLEGARPSAPSAVVELGEVDGVAISLNPQGTLLASRIGNTISVYETAALFEEHAARLQDQAAESASLPPIGRE